jgi:WD40 repeat protein
MFNQNRDGTDFTSLLMKATRLQQGGQYLKAAEIFEDIINHLKRLSMSEKDISRFLGNLAACYWMGGKLDKALEIYEEVKTLRKKYNEIELYALALMNMGEIYGNKTQYVKALSLIKDGLQVAIEKNASEYINIGHQQLMEILSKTGKIYQAIKIGLKPLHYYAELDRNKAFLSFVIKLSEQLRFINAFEATIKILDKGIEATQFTNDLQFRNLLMLEKAKVYQDSFQFDLAEKLMNEALENFKKINDANGIGDVLYSLAFLYEDMGSFLKVLKMGEAHQHFEKIGNKEMAKRCIDISGDWMLGTILNKNIFGKDQEKAKLLNLSKDKREDITDKISQENGIIKLDTDITEITTMFDCIISMDISDNSPIISFGPVNKSIKLWDFKNKRAVLDKKSGINLYDVLVKFIPNTHDMIAVSNITNHNNIHDSSIFIIMQKFFLTKTVDNNYKVVNETFKRLEVPDEETYLDEISEDGKYIYARVNDYIRLGKDSKLESRLSKIFVWESETGSLIKTYRFPDLSISTALLSINYEKGQIFCLNEKLHLEIRNLQNNKLIKEITPHCSPFSNFSVNKNFKVIAYETETGTYEIWDIDSGELISKVNLEGKLVRQINTNIREKDSNLVFDSTDCKLSKDGNLLAFNGADGTFYIYNISEKRVLKKFTSPDKNLVYIKFSNKNDKLLMATYKKESYIVDLKV